MSKERLLRYLEQTQRLTSAQAEVALDEMLRKFQNNFKDVHTTLEKIATKALEQKPASES